MGQIYLISEGLTREASQRFGCSKYFSSQKGLNSDHSRCSVLFALYWVTRLAVLFHAGLVDRQQFAERFLQHCQRACFRR